MGKFLPWMDEMASASKISRSFRRSSLAEMTAGGEEQSEQVHLKPQFFSRRACRFSDGSWSVMSGKAD